MSQKCLLFYLYLYFTYEKIFIHEKIPKKAMCTYNYSNILLLSSIKEVWNDMSMSNKRQNFHFGI